MGTRRRGWDWEPFSKFCIQPVVSGSVKNSRDIW